eukprot:gb/GEZN01004373.1/.p1 GENE.gb/GEZN01004373.1/~~gb/GEZN01004373.1/.p1  ORF type:complete len:553 (-),score=72.13 gb/GEZN01004373.1/:322-1848(-)
MLAWVVCFSPILLTFAWLAPDPYMDEIFHIPQAQAFCSGRWMDYHPAITTGPGLYVFSWALAHLASALTAFTVPVSGSSVLCSLLFLRGTVFLVHCLTSSLLHILLLVLQPLTAPERRAAKTMELSLFPLFFFFSFLYYTDVLATFLVLLMYLVSLQRRHFWSALVGLLALFVRQTNIAWVLWVLACAVLRDYESKRLEVREIGQVGEQQGQQNEKTTQRTRKQTRKEKKEQRQQEATRQQQEPQEGEHPLLRHPIYVSHTLPAGLNFLDWHRRHWWPLLCTYWPYVMVIYWFIVFVWLNQGVALGDRSHHQAGLHVPQLFYFVAFALLFSGTTAFTPKLLREFITDLWETMSHGSSAFFLVQALMTMVQAVRHFTFAHPFLLADNRHYTFYLWKAIWRRNPYYKYALIPLYVYGFWAIHRMLRPRRSVLWQCLFLTCTALAVVPAPLVEFRYFITPFMLLHLHETVSSKTGLLLNVAGGALLNFFTVYMFLLQPFWWQDGSIARFMW